MSKRVSLPGSGRLAELDLVSYGRRGRHTPLQFSAAQLEQIGRTVSGVPEVMIKVSGGGKSADAVHPELVGAMATIRVAELFAAKHVSAEADRVRFMKLVRNAMGRAIEHETPVPAPMLREPRTRTPHRGVERANARTRHGGVSNRDAPAMERG